MESKIALIKILQRYETIEVPEELTLRVNFVYEPDPFEITWTKRMQI